MNNTNTVVNSPSMWATCSELQPIIQDSLGAGSISFSSVSFEEFPAFSGISEYVLLQLCFPSFGVLF